MINKNSQPEILISNISFCDHYQYLFCTTNTGFIVYKIDPFKCEIIRSFEGGLRLGQMIFSKRIFFLNGSGQNTDYPINRITIWDDTKQKNIAEVSLNCKVISLGVGNYDNFIITTYRKAYLYELKSISLLKTYDICSFSPTIRLLKDDFILGYISLSPSTENNVIIRSKNRYLSINSNQTYLSKIAISHNGKFLATSSSNGHIIKLFSLINTEVIAEFRRGTFAKNITYLGFSDRDNYLLCGTENGSVHVFNIKETETNVFNLWGILRQRSIAHLTLAETVISANLIEQNNTIYLISKTQFYSCQLQGDSIVIVKTNLLVYKKDPFTPSPKRTNPNLKSKPINIPQNKDRKPIKTINPNSI